MFNPTLIAITSVYTWFWIAVLVLYIIDWSFGFDKVSAALERALHIYGKLVPIESITPIVLFTTISAGTKIFSTIDSSGFFNIISNLFGIMAIGSIAIMAVYFVFVKGLSKLRYTCIARRKEKARKKSLTPDE